MISLYVSLTLFLALLVWRLVLVGIRGRSLARAIGAPIEQNSVISQCLIVLGRSDTEAIAYNGFQNASRPLSTGNKKERAERLLLRIVALTGAAPMGNGYVLDVGATRFHVREGHVGQLRDLNDPQCKYKETCFYSPRRDMPKAEQMAAALLQLANNPSLFEKWAVQDGLMIKADGQVFTRV